MSIFALHCQNMFWYNCKMIKMSMTANEIRQAFKDYFESKQHLIVPSAPMVVKDDPTLMFTNAGMNQFKEIFLGLKDAASPRVADSQKCLRVSGKHNDLEEVGHDTYHHTMFEMLGNWSFADYFKKEAIEFAWEFLVDKMGLKPENLYATVFEGAADDNLDRDNEAAGYWEKYLPLDHIINGNKKDNFWEMGDVGPCGPCSEIHIDLRPADEKAKISGRDLVNQDHPQVIEIWNLVFIQFNRKASGELETLPGKHVDTGMGFERLCMALQGKTSNYDTDIFQPLLKTIGEIAGKTYGDDEKVDIAMRVIADHIRTIAFSIADGQLPSNVKAGYVIRRILRRAVRYGYTFLGQRSALLFQLLPTLIETMGEAYPELEAQKTLIEKVIKEEEESFLRTLETGIRLLDKIIATTKEEGKNVVEGKVAFVLYDTYGFPLDLTELILKEQDLVVNREEFESEMNKQKERARAASAQETDDWTILYDDEVEEFVGYDYTEVEVKITRYRKVTAKKKTFFELVFNVTPFYGESGGQIGDTGCIKNDAETVAIVQTKKEHNQIIHVVNDLPKNIEASFKACVNTNARTLIANNHTATHLIHEALREVLGTHVEQKGSLVTADQLRFDFTHFQKVSKEEIRQVEKLVNKKIRMNVPLQEHRNTPIQEAKAMGAMALFGEKYGDLVRVIQFGSSVELCGGTHAQSTGQIGYCKITAEGSISAGVRRIEAVTADKAEELIEQIIDTYNSVTELITDPKGLQVAVSKILKENTSLKKDIEAFEAKLVKEAKQTLEKEIKEINGINVLACKVPVKSASQLKDICFMLKAEFENLFCVLGAEFEDEKCGLAVLISDNLVKEKGLNAGQIIRESSKAIQGGGGGQAFFATAGGKKAAGLQEAIDAAVNFIN